MATSAERMRAYRDRACRGIRRLMVDVNEDDLRALAERGYEGAASTDHDQQARAIGLFVSDTIACLDRQSDAVTAASLHCW
jgi:hypothetical protein